MTDTVKIGRKPPFAEDEKLEIRGRSLRSLMWIKFKRNRMAKVGLVILLLLYITSMFCDFFAPYTLEQVFSDYQNHPPMPLHFFDSKGKLHLIPFVYGTDRRPDPAAFKVHWDENPDKIYQIRLFGPQYACH